MTGLGLLSSLYMGHPCQFIPVDVYRYFEFIFCEENVLPRTFEDQIEKKYNLEMIGKTQKH